MEFCGRVCRIIQTPLCSSHSIAFLLLSRSNLFGKLRIFSPSFCFIIIIIITEHDDDNNEGIYKPRGKETAISSVRLLRACVRVLRGRAGDELEVVKKRRRSLSKQQPWRYGGRRDWIPEGRVINPRAKYAKIPAGEFITWQAVVESAGRGGFCCLYSTLTARLYPPVCIYIYDKEHAH